MPTIKDPGYELTRHKKRSQKKSPKKIKHVHDYRDCVLGVPALEFNRAHGFVDCSRPTLARYCVVCGKIDYDNAKWWNTRWISSRLHVEYTEEALRELRPETRTLPYFPLTGYDKYIKLEDK